MPEWHGLHGARLDVPRTWRAGGIIGPTTAKTKDAGAGRVEAIREAVHEAVGEVVAGGSSIRLLIRVRHRGGWRRTSRRIVCRTGCT